MNEKANIAAFAAILTSLSTVTILALLLPTLSNNMDRIRKTLHVEREEFRVLEENTRQVLSEARSNPNEQSQFIRQKRWGKAVPICDCSATNKCPAGPPGRLGQQGLHGKPGQPGQPGQMGEAGLAVMDTAIKYKEGECRVCPFGPKGTRGFPGREGPPGKEGPVGVPGDRGREGAIGAPGLSGERGADGEQGKDGAIGEPGADGVKGERGPVGPPGEKGPAGVKGYKGYPGNPGNNGKAGAMGRAGIPGLDGTDGYPGTVGTPGHPGKPGDDPGYCQCPKRKNKKQGSIPATTKQPVGNDSDSGELETSPVGSVFVGQKLQ